MSMSLKGPNVRLETLCRTSNVELMKEYDETKKKEEEQRNYSLLEWQRMEDVKRRIIG